MERNFCPGFSLQAIKILTNNHFKSKTMDKEQNDSMTKEEFQKRKKEIMADIEKSITEDGTFIYMGRNDHDETILMAGTLPKMSFIIATAMNKSPEVRKVIQVAMKAFNHAENQFDSMEEAAKMFGDKGRGATFQDLIAQFKEHADCESCEGKDKCDIFKYGKDGVSAASPIDMMEKMMTEMGLKPRGQA